MWSTKNISSKEQWSKYMYIGFHHFLVENQNLTLNLPSNILNTQYNVAIGMVVAIHNELCWENLKAIE